MMVVLTFHIGVLTYFNTSKCSHASLHPGKAESCEQPPSVFIRGDLKSQRGFLYTHEVTSVANKVEILLNNYRHLYSEQYDSY